MACCSAVEALGNIVSPGWRLRLHRRIFSVGFR
jgi:hypothetical protein